MESPAFGRAFNVYYLLLKRPFSSDFHYSTGNLFALCLVSATCKTTLFHDWSFRDFTWSYWSKIPGLKPASLYRTNKQTVITIKNLEL